MSPPAAVNGSVAALRGVTLRFLLAILMPGIPIVLLGAGLSFFHARSLALDQGRARLERILGVAETLLQGRHRDLQSDLGVFATQSALDEYDAFTRAGLSDEAEEYRVRIEESAVAFARLESFLEFEFHDRQGRGVVAVRDGRPTMRYRPVSPELPWFRRVLAGEEVVVVLSEGRIRFCRRVELDGEVLGVITVIDSSEHLFGPVLEKVSAFLPGSRVSLRWRDRSRTSGFEVVRGSVSVAGHLVVERTLAAPLAGARLELGEPKAQILAQHSRSLRDFSLVFCLSVLALVVLLILSVHRLLVAPLRRIHAKAAAFRDHRVVPSERLEQDDEFGELDAILRDVIVALGDLQGQLTGQAGAIAETTATAVELAASMEVNREAAREVLDQVAESVLTTRVGVGASRSAKESVAKLEEHITVSVETIRELADEVRAIREISATVNDLAEQSKFLALNASIEAARAGEAGRSFGVVAIEVRNLADRSKQSTEEIRKIVATIIASSELAVAVVGEGKTFVQESLALVDTQLQTIDELSRVIARAGTSAEKIHAAVEGQADAVARISGAMQAIRTAVVEPVESSLGLPSEASSGEEGATGRPPEAR